MAAQPGRGAESAIAAERALAHAEARFQALVEWLPAVVYEAEPGPDGAFHYVSPRIEDLLGYTVEEWLGDRKLWRDRLHPDDLDNVLRIEREQEDQSRQAGARLGSEYRMLHRDGRIVWIRDEARLTADETGSPLWRGVLIDVTAAHTAGAGAGTLDVYRLTCHNCGTVRASERIEPCRECGETDADAVSLNATLGALAASRRQVAGLLDGVHRHLETIDLNLRAVSPRERRGD